MREEAQQWFRQAEHDFKTANLLFEHQVYDFCAFACFQSSEKAFKAVFLEKNKALPPKTHELMALAKAVGADELLDAVRDLNPPFVQSRYPDAANAAPFEAYSGRTAQRCLSNSEEALQWCRKKIR